MAKQKYLGLRGLWMSQNRLFGAPPGALSEAHNVIIRLPNLAEVRPGLEPTLGVGTWSPSEEAKVIFGWDDDGFGPVHLVHHGTTLTYARIGDGTGTLANYTGSYTPASARIRFGVAKRCLYFTTNAGAYRLDAYNGTPVLSGIPRPLSISVATGGAANAWTTAPASLAYRASIVFTDAKDNQYESAPSSRGYYRLATGAASDSPTVTVHLPSGLSTSYKIRLYRSAQTTSDTDEPSDELRLVYERFITSAEVTARSLAITDVVPDGMRGQPGYFNPSRGEAGLVYAERPPLANDIAWHKDTMFYADTESKHRLTLRLLAVSSHWVASTAYVVGDYVVNDSGKLYVCDTSGTSDSSGGPTGETEDIEDGTAQWDYVAAALTLSDGDTITIAGTAYTAKLTTSATTHFAIDTSASPQVAIQKTVVNLCNTVNSYASNTSVYAYYLSGPDDGAGIFLIEERGIGGNSFAAISSRATCWAPELPSSGTTVSSKDDDASNRLYFSKPSEPESVPLLNYIDVGSKSDPIVRVVPLRDSLYIFKESEGIYRLTGESGSFSIREHDATVLLIGIDTIGAVGNELYALTNQGVVAVSDVGVRVVSSAIEDVIEPWSAYGAEAAVEKREDIAPQYIHAVGLEELGAYILWLPTDNLTPPNMRAYVYVPRTDAWTTWGINAVASTLQAPASKRRLVVATRTSRRLEWLKNYFDGTDYSDDAEPIAAAITWLPEAADAPGILKQWTRADFFFQPASQLDITSATAGFATELDKTATTVTLDLSATLAATGTDVSPISPVVSPVPLPKQIGSNIVVSLDISTENWLGALGVILTFEPAGDMGGR